MTTIKIDLPDNQAKTLQEQAATQGLTLSQWLVKMVGQYTPPESIAHLQKTDPEEWARQFHAWAESHDRTTPLLSDEAISRENIYPDPS